MAGLATLLLIASTAMAQRPLGIDVSFWQGTITQAQWNQVFASGRVFAFIKSTQGKLSSQSGLRPQPKGFVNSVYSKNGVLA